MLAAVSGYVRRTEEKLRQSEEPCAVLEVQHVSIEEVV